MDTENNRTQKNKGAVLLLLILGVFGFVCIKYTRVKDTKVTDANTQATSCSNTVVDNSYDDTDNPIFLNISESGDITNVTPTSGKGDGSVLGMSCASAQNKYTASSACTLPSSQGSTTVQGFVSTEANIIMTSITVPVRLLSGIYSVKDSNREITKDNPVYKPAGEQFDDKQILVYTTPDEGNAKVKSTIIDGSVSQEAYSTRYTISTSGKEGGGDATISEYSGNDCGATCNNTANSNPDKSNKAGEYLKSVNYNYPGQKDKEEDGDIIKIEGKCEDLETVDVEDKSVTTCFDIWKSLLGTLGSLFPSGNWTSCDSEEEGCMNAADIVVKMSPMFENTNKYTRTRNKSAMSPTSSATYKPVYVVTPCTANVGGNASGFGGKNVAVKCIWDMGYLFDERKAAEFDDAGGSDTPTEDQYIEFLKKESSTRTDALYDM